MYNKNDGFTLIEIMVVIFVLGVIVTAALNVYSSGFNIFHYTKNRANIQGEIRFVVDFITENIKYAKSVEIVNSMESIGSNEKIIALVGNEIKYKEGSSTARNIATGPIFHLDFGLENNYLTLEIADDNYTINTKIILNNCDNPIDNSTEPESKAIIFTE